LRGGVSIEVGFPHVADEWPAMNILFICSRNQWRSPTAEQVWCKRAGLTVRSAGTSPKARHTVTTGDLKWADVVFVMEPKHQQILQAEFRQFVRDKRIEVLNIPDNYKYMDPELVAMLEVEADSFLESLTLKES
jgi:predicted protein tyrosine phosphatase